MEYLAAVQVAPSICRDLLHHVSVSAASHGVAPPQRWQGAFGLAGLAKGNVVLTPTPAHGPATLPAACCPPRLAGELVARRGRRKLTGAGG
jgi:hypothetical protein